MALSSGAAGAMHDDKLYCDVAFCFDSEISVAKHKNYWYSWKLNLHYMLSEKRLIYKY